MLELIAEEEDENPYIVESFKSTAMGKSLQKQVHLGNRSNSSSSVEQLETPAFSYKQPSVEVRESNRILEAYTDAQSAMVNVKKGSHLQSNHSKLIQRLGERCEVIRRSESSQDLESQLMSESSQRDSQKRKSVEPVARTNSQKRLISLQNIKKVPMQVNNSVIVEKKLPLKIKASSITRQNQSQISSSTKAIAGGNKSFAIGKSAL